jgi:hypothetical protein
MGSTHPFPNGPMEGIEAARRVGWARFYAEQEHAEHLRVVNHQLNLQVDALFNELVDLADAVLTRRNPEAFAFAWRIRQLIDQQGA